MAAVNDVSFRVEKSEILGLIGPNGAGKTTLFNLISGFLEPDSGEIYYNNEIISHLKPHEIAQRGIGRTFQTVRLFRKMTTFENMIVPTTWFSGKLHDFGEKALKYLKVFDLADLKDELAENLSGGQQKLLELARASMMDPELFLLDEPFHGIHPSLKKKIVQYVKATNTESNKTFIVVSHDMRSLMEMCGRVIAMNAGNVIAAGTPEEIRNNENVQEAYLGLEVDD